MQRIVGSEWPKALWKLLTNPTFEVLAAIVVMALATWFVVQTEVDLRHNAHHGPLLFGHK